MKRILVVDDERLTADTLGIILRRHGFDAKVSYSVDDALECASSFDPQLLLCDITMPGRTGLDLIEAVAQERPDCPVQFPGRPDGQDRRPAGRDRPAPLSRSL